jgi:hypothetical protein
MTMRTRARKQDRTDAESDEAASSRRSSSAAGASSPTTTVVAITKAEGPTVAPSSSMSRASKLPKHLHFPLVAVLSLSLSALGYALTDPYTRAVLAPRARPLDTWEELALLTGWKVFELGLGWFGNYDGYDLAALSVLTHGPAVSLSAHVALSQEFRY